MCPKSGRGAGLVTACGRASKSYSWEPNDRLKMIVDALAGPVQFSHDGLGSLTAAAYPDGKVDLRMPDAVGNLFRTNERRDRKYGPAGQLLESWSQDGVTRYAYDAEGNLGKKVLPGGREWTYAWNAAGMLAKVVRPDGKEVEFGYDALGRRVWKKYQGKTTKWIWDGNVPVHEVNPLQARVKRGRGFRACWGYGEERKFGSAIAEAKAAATKRMGRGDSELS